MPNERKSITELARELRHNATTAERKLWQHLRKRQLKGRKFLRQKPLIYRQINRKAFFFIADFYCAEQQLVIELDGKYHNHRNEYDRNRNLVIEEMGLTVLRFKNDELNDMDSVLTKIASYL
ncbi:MAG: endonuclease domain-containing protein [Balneolaceae bacterium]|nr:endonuclease domain-containing protein [Balneolaceae bacterium]